MKRWTRPSSWTVSISSEDSLLQGGFTSNLVGQLLLMLLTHRIRQQAGSYRSEAGHRLAHRPGPLYKPSEVTRVWAALRTNAVDHSTSLRLTHRIRQHAGAHRVMFSQA